MLKVLKTAESTSRISIEEVEITPHVAEAWLSKNFANRKINKGVVKKYARDIESGSWRLTGDAIRFDEHGNLLDGQQRPTDAVAAGKGFQSLVVYGLSADVQEVMDGALPRRYTDMLTMRGEKNTTQLSAALRWLVAYRFEAARTNLTGLKLTNQEMDALLDHHRPIAVSVAQSMHAVGPYVSLLAFIHYAASTFQNETEKANAFVSVFKTGIPSRDGCVAHKLREYLIKMKGEKAQLTREAHFLLVMRVWNAFVKDEPMTRLYAPRDRYIQMADLDAKDIWIPPSIIRQFAVE